MWVIWNRLSEIEDQERVRVGQQALSKADQNTKAKNDEFDVPFDMIVANGFGSGPSASRAWN